MSFKFYFLSELGHYFISGLYVTLQLAVLCLILGTICGLLMGLARLSRFKPLSAFAAAYISFIQGVPLLVQIYIVFYGINWDISAFAAAVIALTINTTAYVAEIIRAGIQSVDKGQMEAARSLGLTKGQTMRLVILPQALKNILPALGNQLIVAIKDTSMVSVLGLCELTYNTDTIRTITFLAFEPLIISAFIYFIVSYFLKKGVDAMEHRMNRLS
jgi:His/Glu/Gln/Arg/opine family amino acid ABC transporter permease subunit